MKIGILNFQHSDHNYGAVLQASALQCALSDFDTVEHIDFIPGSNNNLIGRIKGLVVSLMRQVGVLKKRERASVGNKKAFENFRNTWIVRSPNKFYTMKQLKKLENSYDAVIVGSDQVWRLAYTKQASLAYFLSFVGDETLKISYAASFGRNVWEAEHDKKFTLRVKNLLSRFSSISVREDSAVDICRKEFGITPTHVLDPTLLVGRKLFDRIADTAKTSNNYKHIVYYKLDTDQNFIDKVNLIQNKLSLDSENIYHSFVRDKASYIEVNSWLDKIRNSELVITDSFHCVCLAILFRKKFICVANENRGLSRIESLLNALSIESVICSDIEHLDDKRYIHNEINYDSVHKLLKEQRVESMNFLKNALIRS